MPRKQPQNDGGAFLAAKSRPEEEEKAQHYTIILPPIMFTFNFEHRSYHPRFPCQLLQERNLLAAKTWQALTLPSLSHHHGYNLMNGDQPLLSAFKPKNLLRVPILPSN